MAAVIGKGTSKFVSPSLCAFFFAVEAECCNSVGHVAKVVLCETNHVGNIGYGGAEGEVSQDAEGLQTMRTLADNMAYMLKQFATGTAKFPEWERWQMTNFIR